MNSDQIQSILRTVFKTAGTYFVTQGYTTNDGWDKIIGAGAIVVGMLWSYWFHKTESKTDSQ